MTPVRAGFGQAVITPATPVMLAGFGDRVELATEVHDDLEVRALYLAGGGGDATGGAVCLIVCDLLGMSTSFADPIRRAVAGDLGLDPSHVLTACTHTHSGPSCIAGSEAIGWPTPTGYAEQLLAGCRTAAAEARHAATPATLAYRRAPLPEGISVNRRGLPYAPWLALLDIQALDGARVGVLANLAVHPVALGPECLAVSADWVAPFRSSLEAALGGTAVMLSGALGDVNPRHVHRQDNDCAANGFDEAEELGRELAQAVQGEVGSAEILSAGIEVVRCEEFSAPVGGTLLSMLGGADSMSVDLLEWSLGGARLVSLPGEAFHAFGLAVEAARAEPLLLAGLAPAWLGYLPVPFTEGYEEQMSMGEPFVRALHAALTIPS
ncbi:MAG TPA: hypothetical protein VGG38_08440 [Acidimicrobiales bacterium]